MLDLVGPSKQRDRGAGIAGVISECSNTLTRRIREELNIVQDASPASKATEVLGPAFLAFVAMTELNMGMNERN